MSKTVPSRMAATLFAAVLATSVPGSVASAESAPPAEPAKPATVSILSAYVASSGGLIRKRGAISAQNSGGAYTVVFNRKVVGCFYAATAAAGGPIIATAQALEGNFRAVFVNLYRGDGTPQPAPFYLTVTCYD